MRSTNERVSDHVVMKLAELYLKKGRNITTDNYFTSVKLANLLKSKNTSLLGTINKNQREVSCKIKNLRDEQYATRLYKSEDILLTVYRKTQEECFVAKTLHTDAAIADNQKKNTRSCQVLQRNKIWCGCGRPNGSQVHCQDNHEKVACPFYSKYVGSCSYKCLGFIQRNQ